MQYFQDALNKYKCPYCGYKMPIKIGQNAKAEDLWVKCKNPKCKREFELRINRVP